MKIRLLVSRGGLFGVQNRGDEIDVSDDEAVSMIAAGQAEPVREAKVERAVRTAKGERAVK